MYKKLKALLKTGDFRCIKLEGNNISISDLISIDDKIRIEVYSNIDVKDIDNNLNEDKLNELLDSLDMYCINENNEDFLNIVEGILSNYDLSKLENLPVYDLIDTTIQFLNSDIKEILFKTVC